MTRVGKLLVIDDDKDIGELVSECARELGLACQATTDPAAFQKLFAADTTLILLDLMMPEMDGIEVLRMLGEMRCKAGIVLMSGISTRVIETASKLAQTLGLRVIGHLQKPFRLAELEAILKKHPDSAGAPAQPRKSAVAFGDSELESAIERDELVLHYQPQIDIKTRKLAGLEALVRWQHPERGLIYPDSFLPRTAELGLLVRLGWLTLNRGMGDLSRFAGPDGVVPRLSMNVTVDSLLDLKFPDDFIALAHKHRIPADRVTVEITETGLIKELARTLDVLTRLRIKDVQLSIDDFGTGYAMMQQLRNVPATELKIDMSFVQNLQHNAGDRVMVQKTIELGHELGLHVVAEGVETEGQLDFLRSHGCDIAQGYLCSRPLPPAEMAQWLETYRTRGVA